MLPNLNGYQSYQKNKYETASPHRLITMLYEGAIRFANQAIIHIENNDIAQKSIAIQKFQDIIFELISCLNFKEGKEISSNLLSLYNYVIELSTKSSVTKTTAPLQEAIQVITEIKDAWVEIGKDVQMNG